MQQIFSVTRKTNVKLALYNKCLTIILSNIKIFVLYSTAFLLCNTVLAQENIQHNRLPQTAYWTAPYTQLFDEADYIYPYEPQVTYQIIDIVAIRATQSQEFFHTSTGGARATRRRPL